MKILAGFTLSLLLTAPAYCEFDYWALKSVKEIYLDDERAPHFPASTEIEFTNGHLAKTTVIEFKFVTFLHPPGGETFIVFTGRTCTECDMRTSLYIQAAEKKEYDHHRYGYPGKVKHYLDGTLINDTRLFYGQCLKKGEQTVVFYSKYPGSDNNWHKSVYEVDFVGKETQQNPADIAYDTIKDTEAFVKQGKCAELDGKNRYSEP